jgi:phage tail-like protein
MAGYYPPVGFHFKVEFGFLPSDTYDARFQEVSGMTSELGIEELIEGGENRFTHRLPNRAKYSNLVLKRGYLANSNLIEWINNAITNFDFEPTTVNVTLLNEKHVPLADTFSYQNAWPVKWSVSDYKAQDNGIVVETLELSYNYFTRIAV